MRPGPIQFPREYDAEAQKNVEMAQAELVSLGKDAFPALIAHLDDEGYSLSIETAVLRSLSVGEVCFSIIEQQVDPAPMRYKVRVGADGKWHGFQRYLSQHLGHETGDREGMRQWWQERRQLCLREMQIEAYAWRIEHERRIGFPDAAEREQILQPLIQELDKLKAE